MINRLCCLCCSYRESHASSYTGVTLPADGIRHSADMGRSSFNVNPANNTAPGGSCTGLICLGLPGDIPSRSSTGSHQLISRSISLKTISAVSAGPIRPEATSPARRARSGRQSGSAHLGQLSLFDQFRLNIGLFAIGLTIRLIFRVSANFLPHKHTLSGCG